MTMDGPAIGETPLLERERDLAVLEEALGRERGLAGPVLIEGPAGIGKSRLVDELIGRAGRLGVRALAGRGAHLERDFAFGVVRQLFEPVLADGRERERLLAGIRVSIAKVIKAPGAAAGSCDASDFTLTDRTITVAADVPSGRGTGSWTGGTVAFNNKPGIDQNACQGATVKLRYTTS